MVAGLEKSASRSIESVTSSSAGFSFLALGLSAGLATGWGVFLGVAGLPSGLEFELSTVSVAGVGEAGGSADGLVLMEMF